MGQYPDDWKRGDDDALAAALRTFDADDNGGEWMHGRADPLATALLWGGYALGLGLVLWALLA